MASLRPAFRLGLARFIPLVVCDLLFFGLVVVLYLPLYFIARGLGADRSIALWASFAIALVVAEARFLVARAVVVAEGPNPLRALQRSWRLTRGNAVRTGVLGAITLPVSAFEVAIGRGLTTVLIAGATLSLDAVLRVVTRDWLVGDQPVKSRRRQRSAEESRARYRRREDYGKPFS